MSENGAEKEIQWFLSDGAALPRDPEMRTQSFAHSTRLRAQSCTKKSPFVTRYQAKPTVRAEWVYNHNMWPCLQSASEIAVPVVICKSLKNGM